MKTIIIGFDAFDPVIFERLHAEGKTPNLSRLAEQGGYTRFGVSNPPQSEVSWTSIATGLNPGGHGIFDFVHRNPKSYSPQVSLLPTKSNVLGRQFIPPHSATTIFESAVQDGYPGISLWWPATFPARLDSPVWSIPGLGTPDIFGRLGVGIFYSVDELAGGDKKTRLERLVKSRDGEFLGELEGPVKTTLKGPQPNNLPIKLRLLNDESAVLTIGNTRVTLKSAEWSPFITLTFRVGFGMSIKAVTRALFSISPSNPSLYLLPLQIHPLRSPWPYGTPKKLLKHMWRDLGPYLSLGWPQDTTGLEENFISDEQFIALCEAICAYRERTLLDLLETFEEGVLACVFDSLDRMQHMFLRDRLDLIESWYVKLDALFGRIYKKVSENPRLNGVRVLVVSDHGFGEYKYQVNLNRWLLNQGFLSSTSSGDKGNFGQTDWSKSKLYAIGLNSLYINLSGREADGQVSPEERTSFIDSVSKRLLDWKGPDGKFVISKLTPQETAFSGPYTEFAPDFLVGYTPGYRASALTGLGDWDANEIVLNQDHWGADHCFDAEYVPGVIFSNQGLSNYQTPTYADFPHLTLNKDIQQRKREIDPHFSDEDQDKVNERLRELGYL